MVGCTYFYSLEPRPVPPLLVQTEEWGLSTLLWAAEHKASGVEGYQAPRQRALKSPPPSRWQGEGVGCTSWTRKASCMILGLRLRNRSMVSYWPWQALSFSGEPSACFSSTNPTRKMILTPAWGKRAMSARGPLESFSGNRGLLWAGLGARVLP